MASPKRVWRRRLRAARARLAASARQAADRRICAYLIELAAASGVRRAAVYAPLGAEADPTAFVTHLLGAGGLVAYPRVTGPGEMELVAVSDLCQLTPRFKGIREPLPELPALAPTQLDLIVVPGVGFDRRGNRLGQGMGFYDRLLSDPALGAQKVGIGYAAQLVGRIPVDAHDVPLDAVVTERGVIRPDAAEAGPLIP